MVDRVACPLSNDPPVTFGYDPVGHTIKYTYDAIGQRAAMTAPNGGIFTYAYGPRGAMDHLVNPQGDRTTFTHDAAGRRTLKELADGSRASYTYDAASQVAQVYNLKSDDSVIAGFAYDYDPAGNRAGALESGGDRVTWTYDATNQLTREQRSGDWAYDHTYAYDPLGNRLVKDASGALTTSTYDLGNQLVTSQNANSVTTYTYDLAGNLHIVEQPTGQRTTTTWDDQNRQIGVLQPTGAITTNTYRFDRLRYIKQEPQATTKFLWDVNNYLAETDERDDIQALYTNEPQPYGNLISQYRKGPTLWLPRYYQYDALGSTRALTDESGDVTDTYLYGAWGNKLAVSGSSVNPFRWGGRVGYYWDEGTGTFYIRARVYDPVTGRWLSQDPLGFTDGLNLYGVYFVPSGMDPSGLSSCDNVTLTGTFEPKDAPRSVPWSQASLPGDMVGETRFWVSALCECKCCDDRKWRPIECDVTVTFHILIDRTGMVEFTPETAYGHEQRHVRNARRWFENQPQLVRQFMADLAYDEEDKCRWRAGGDLSDKLFRRYLFGDWQAEVHHNAPGPPEAETPYPPIGPMPPRPVAPPYWISG